MQPAAVAPVAATVPEPAPSAGDSAVPAGSDPANYASVGQPSSTLPNNGILTSGHRTVYIGGVTATTPVEAVIDTIKTGPLEQIKLLTEKSCIFVTFLYASHAEKYVASSNPKSIIVNGTQLRVSWGKPSPPNQQLLTEYEQNGASRAVYVGGVSDQMTEDTFHERFSSFGPIERIRFQRDKSNVFIHYCNFANAITCVTTLTNDPLWTDYKISYGKDRCTFSPPQQQQQQQQNVSAQITPAQLPQSPPVANTAAAMASGPTFDGNRTVYLGNIHPETTCEELCNAIRGGVLDNIRYIIDKHIAFVTFVDAAAAAQLYHTGTFSGIIVRNRRLKIGWGKNLPISPLVKTAYDNGATRNVYIGNLDAAIDDAKLRQDFSQFGDIELINMLPEKQCGFVSFTNIVSAVKAVEGMRGSVGYERYKINFGKDRCANPPRPPKGASANNNNNNNNNSNEMVASPPGAVPGAFGVDVAGGAGAGANTAVAGLPGLAGAANPASTLPPAPFHQQQLYHQAAEYGLDPSVAAGAQTGFSPVPAHTAASANYLQPRQVPPEQSQYGAQLYQQQQPPQYQQYQHTPQHQNQQQQQTAAHPMNNNGANGNQLPLQQQQQQSPSHANAQAIAMAAASAAAAAVSSATNANQFQHLQHQHQQQMLMAAAAASGSPMGSYIPLPHNAASDPQQQQQQLLGNAAAYQNYIQSRAMERIPPYQHHYPLQQ
ncbi:hypothetical protein GQ42DRAFT_143084 [Ramicandelaber brevisporus]|nr:hypothetical protein GQ42DRAFT_143084 [Ramicandelaber brevisporus]